MESRPQFETWTRYLVDLDGDAIAIVEDADGVAGGVDVDPDAVHRGITDLRGERELVSGQRQGQGQLSDVATAACLALMPCVGWWGMGAGRRGSLGGRPGAGAD